MNLIFDIRTSQNSFNKLPFTTAMTKSLTINIDRQAQDEKNGTRMLDYDFQPSRTFRNSKFIAQLVQ